MKELAVIILNWNGRKLLEQFLPVASRYSITEDADLIVADNGSTDDSVEWVKAHHPEVKVLSFSENYGFAEGYNKAIKQTQYKYTILLNSDVEVTEDWTRPLLDFMRRNSDVGALQPKIRSWKERTKFEYAGAAGGVIDYLGYPFCRGRLLRHLEHDEGQYDDERALFWVSGAAYCCRAELFHRMGGFDGDFFAHMEEIDLQWRMQLGGWRIAVEPRSVVYHLGGGTLPASPNKIYLNHRNNLAMLFKCSSPKQRMVVAVLRPFTDIAEALAHLLMLRPRNAWAILRAWWAFIKWHKMLGRKRREVVRREGVEIRGIYPRSIIVRYLFGKRTFNKIM